MAVLYVLTVIIFCVTFPHAHPYLHLVVRAGNHINQKKILHPIQEYSFKGVTKYNIVFMKYSYTSESKHTCQIRLSPS